MRLYLAAVLVLFTLPQLVRADFVGPGFSRLPRHLIVESGGDFSAYRFWLMSERGPEPLELAPGKPCRIDGRERIGLHRDAYIIAVPADLAERLPVTGLWDQIRVGKLPAGVLRSELIDFDASVPFYDSRKEVVDTYRLDLLPGERVNLAWLGQNEGAWWVKACWVSAGVFAAAGFVLGGYWVLRRFATPPNRSTPGTSSTPPA